MFVCFFGASKGDNVLKFTKRTENPRHQGKQKPGKKGHDLCQDVWCFLVKKLSTCG
jgi:hypothetical protein